MSTDIKVLVNEIENYLWPTEEEYRKSCADFTALLPVYIHDDLNHFMMAVKSVFKNTVKPAEILIMQDGPVHENMVVFIDFLLKKYPHILHHISNQIKKTKVWVTRLQRVFYLLNLKSLLVLMQMICQPKTVLRNNFSVFVRMPN